LAEASRLIERLTREGRLSAAQSAQAQKRSREEGKPLEKILVEMAILSEEERARLLAEELGIPFVSLASQEIDAHIAHLVPEELVRKYNVIPVRLEGNQLFVATSSPEDLAALDEISLVTGYTVRPMVTTEKELSRAISQYFSVQDTTRQELIDIRFEAEGPSEAGPAIVLEEAAPREREGPVVRLVNSLIRGAINSRASDIHLEPQHPEMRVRYRIDGILHDIMNVPPAIRDEVVSRVKIMAGLDITERRRPQDGHISIRFRKNEYDLRVSTLLTVDGEKVVLRILEKGGAVFSLADLGMLPEQQTLFRSLISEPQGMILLTGPTGSGKTTTLYAVLRSLNSLTHNIITVEDPVEYRLRGINQIQVNPLAGITFATGLRTILRQDPDIIMVGEIRDLETADIAVQAALTGHLVFSTLHTNDAPSSMTRLRDLGVAPFLIASSVIGAVAQRLVRTICTECKEDYVPERSLLEEFGFKEDEKLQRGKGCKFCLQTGYRGRTGLFEMFRIDDEMGNAVQEEATTATLKKMALKKGMKTLYNVGIEKVRRGITTLEEIRRVVPREAT